MNTDGKPGKISVFAMIGVHRCLLVVPFLPLFSENSMALGEG